MVSFLISLFHTKKAPKNQPDPADPLFFVGTWQFKDHRNRIHRLEIGPDLKLLIDGKDMSAKVSLLTRYELSYIDKFGYKLEIRGNESQPIKFCDKLKIMTYICIQQTTQRLLINETRYSLGLFCCSNP